MRSSIISLMLVAVTATAALRGTAQIIEIETVNETVFTAPERSDFSLTPDTTGFASLPIRKPAPLSLYELPYSRTLKQENWGRLWANTGVLAGAFVGTLVVLECLPEDATTWNRAALQKRPPLKRWFRNIFKRGPEWDHDNPIFNYVLHPYAGAAYFMAARSNGFNFYQSLLYSACVSTIGWEFGIEACMERPSIQDIFITPLVGSVLGELFYKAKRSIVAQNYRLLGTPVLGYIAAFFLDPVNEFMNIFYRRPEHKLDIAGRGYTVTSSLMPTLGNGTVGFAFSCTF